MIVCQCGGKTDFWCQAHGRLLTEFLRLRVVVRIDNMVKYKYNYTYDF